MFMNSKDTLRGYTSKNMHENFVNCTIRGYAHYLVKYYKDIDLELLTLLAKCDNKFPAKLAKYMGTVLTTNRYNQLRRKLKEDHEPEYDSKSLHIVEVCNRFINTKNKKGITFFVESNLKTDTDHKDNNLKSTIHSNIKQFTSLFNLARDESKLVTFLFILRNWKRAEEYFEDHLEATTPLNRQTLSVILDIPVNNLRNAITSRLSKLGIVEEDDYKYLRLTGTFSQFLFDLNEQAILEDYYWKKLNASSLKIDKHLVPAEVTDHVLRLIRQHDNSSSTNILIYGSPGSGKTSYAKSLIRELGLEAYEIVNSDDNSVDTRRAALVACLNMIGGRTDGIVLADDADNILSTQDSFSFRGEVSDKSWLNSLMDDPNTKVIWIVNDVSMIEDSVKRRFAYSYHFKPFSTRQRHSVWMSVLEEHGVKTRIKPDTVHALARQYKVSTGVIDISVLKAKETADKGEEAFFKALTLNLDSHVQLQANGRRSKRLQVAPEYSLEGLNMSGDLNALLGQIRAYKDRLQENDPSRRPVVGLNMLLHGVPGAGKSEFAKFLAQELELDLIVKRASDMLNMYVGESEKLVAEAFNEAESKEAVLVIDEIDSFLSSRQYASRNYEVTLVNEFLTQIEQFNGVLVGTTNTLKMLDQACLRRFSHKIEFKYLTPRGCLSFYDKILSPLVDHPLTTEEMNVISSFSKLTPGDFRVVRDKLYYSKELNHAVIMTALRQEYDCKVGVLPIGFRK